MFCQPRPASAPCSLFPATYRFDNGPSRCNKLLSSFFSPPPGLAKAPPCKPLHSPPPRDKSSRLRCRYLPPAAVLRLLQRMRELSGPGSHLMLHSMPPPPPDELAEAHVPYEFTASAADCAALLQQTGWRPAPAVTYASALSDVAADTTLQRNAVQGLSAALSASTSSCAGLDDASAPYFKLDCTCPTPTPKHACRFTQMGRKAHQKHHNYTRT